MAGLDARTFRTAGRCPIVAHLRDHSNPRTSSGLQAGPRFHEDVADLRMSFPDRMFDAARAVG
jgi:hypothetical protein